VVPVDDAFHGARPAVEPVSPPSAPLMMGRVVVGMGVPSFVVRETNVHGENTVSAHVNALLGHRAAVSSAAPATPW
jgi:hypothetical protein